MSILAAQIPDKPNAPTTTINGDFVDITWDEPAIQGSPITEYRILVRQSDSVTFSTELTNCDGTEQTIIDTRLCSVPIDLLRSSPFSLTWGSSVVATITAFNTYGTSQTSEEGNGAVILTNPDAPLNLQEIVVSKTATSISVQWTEGAANGGDDVIDYSVTIRPDESLAEVVSSGVTDLQFTATGLMTGQIYHFKVQSRNSFGLSGYSDELTILCAEEPAQPAAPVTQTVDATVVISWLAPLNNGSPITGYTISLRQSDLNYSV